MDALFSAFMMAMSQPSSESLSPMAKSLMTTITSTVDRTNTKEKKLAHFTWLLTNPGLTELTENDLARIMSKLASEDWLEGLAVFKEALIRLPPVTVLAAGRKYIVRSLDVPKTENTLAFLAAGLVGVGPPGQSSSLDYSLLLPNPESYVAMLQNNNYASLLVLFKTGCLDDIQARCEAKYNVPSLLWCFNNDSDDLVKFMVPRTSDRDLISMMVLGSIKFKQVITMLKLKSWPPLVAMMLDNISDDEKLLELLDLESAKAIPVGILNQILGILITNIVPVAGIDFGVVGAGAEAGAAALASCFNPAIWSVVATKLVNKVAKAYSKGIVLSGSSKDGWDSDCLKVIKKLVELGGQIPVGCEALVSEGRGKFGGVSGGSGGDNEKITDEDIDKALEELYSA